MRKRPTLSKTTKVSDFKNYYWDKLELIKFCRENRIPQEGGKIELSERIEYFLSSGGKVKSTPRKKPRSSFDSDQEITVNTPVIHYKSDAKTREFFVSQIGDAFRFNCYLRSFAKQENNGELTYGDLVQGYKDSLQNKKTTIDKQFEYNQFQRDFHKNNFKRSALECNQAWKLIKQAPGGSTYKDYLKLVMQKKPYLDL